jgi:hypothetical protein
MCISYVCNYCSFQWTVIYVIVTPWGALHGTGKEEEVVQAKKQVTDGSKQAEG